MQQSALWHDTIYDAMSGAVLAAGGPKKVSARLWPTLDTSSATSRLRGCLSPDHAQKMCPEELLMLAKLARDGGDNSIMEFLARELGCEVKALQPAEAKKRAKKARVSALLSELARLSEDE